MLVAMGVLLLLAFMAVLVLMWRRSATAPVKPMHTRTQLAPVGSGITARKSPIRPFNGACRSGQLWRVSLPS